MNLICGECKKKDQVSKVRIEEQLKSYEPMDIFWDEDGKQHFHNPNYNIEHYICSNGHRFQLEHQAPDCPICKWKAPKPDISKGQIVKQKT